MTEKEYKLFHGSQFIVDSPQLKAPGSRKDFGPGFYCTLSEEAAKEWACAGETDGFANQYTLETEGLHFLNLDAHRFNILSWLALLLENRAFAISSETAQEGREYLLKTFLPKVERYDVIVGLRADNSWFSIANAFLNNDISLVELRRSMRLGEEGMQYVLRTKKALAAIRFEASIPADRRIYYPQMLAKDARARHLLEKNKGRENDGEAVYLIDIMRGEWKKNDPRLRKRLSK